MAPSEHKDRRGGQWFWRRSLVFVNTGFCMTLETWLAWYGQQGGELHKLQAEGCFWLLTGGLAIYVLGATTQDIISFVTALRGGMVKNDNRGDTHDRPVRD